VGPLWAQPLGDASNAPGRKRVAPRAPSPRCEKRWRKPQNDSVPQYSDPYVQPPNIQSPVLSSLSGPPYSVPCARHAATLPLDHPLLHPSCYPSTVHPLYPFSEDSTEKGARHRGAPDAYVCRPPAQIGRLPDLLLRHARRRGGGAQPSPAASRRERPWELGKRLTAFASSICVSCTRLLSKAACY